MTDSEKAQRDVAASGEPIELARADGPWNYEDAPADQKFVAFGPLKIPALMTLKVRVEADPATKRIGAVGVLVDGCLVQLQVLASPRGSEVWGSVRRQIADRVRSGGGSTQAIEGEFGTELIATLPGKLPNGMPSTESLRYVGIEGDRWLLRAAVRGSRGLADATVLKVNDFLTHCAVDRGSEAMGAGTVMELAMPTNETDKDGARTKPPTDEQ